MEKLLDPFERVRISTKRVVNQARYIRWQPEKLAELAAKLDPIAIRARYTYEDDFHLLAAQDPESQLNYVMTLDTINFGSGFSSAWKALTPRPHSLYMTIAEGLKGYVEAGGELGPKFAANVTPQELGRIFGVPADFRLIEMFAASLNQLGQWVLTYNYNSYVKLTEKLPSENKAAALINLLATELLYFDDQAQYNGEKVYFYKRAQILVNDLHLAFKGQSFGDFPDIARLTTFADNLVPHIFKIEGILEYNEELEARIERGEPLMAGSPEEVEIRAFGIQCVEELTRILGSKLFPAQVDVFLWNLGQDKRYKDHPRHLTETFFY